MNFESIAAQEHFKGRTPGALDAIILENIDNLPLNASDIKAQLEKKGAHYLDSVIETRVERFNTGELTRDNFSSKPLDMLDVIILSELSDEPLRVPDIRRRLDEDGIPGFTDIDIQKRLELYVRLSEAVPTYHGYIRYSAKINDEAMLGATFQLCRRPSQHILNKAIEPHRHSYIEDGVNREKSHAIPVPKGSRLFARLYCYYARKGFTAHFSHIYAYKYKDGPIQPIDYWAHITEEL